MRQTAWKEQEGPLQLLLNLIALIQKRASEGLMLPSAAAAKETAAASAVYRHTTQCHQWLGKGTCSRGPTCSWAHDPEFKGRTDLVLTCPHLAAEGKCPLKNCYYRLTTGTLRTPSGAANLPVTLPVTLPSKDRAAAAVHDTHAHEMAEIKTMLYDSDH